ncbi:Membrane protein involved in the export of O-antigen and teichoic acid [Lachnospiraceae bacterium KH1T2]|nr:Membrane protein involved in the export of O-antigen and teichoic acid [Lachnospiraceae bacterium KH1T2]
MKDQKTSLKVNAVLNVIKRICSILFPMITFPFASRVLGKFYYGKVNFGASIVSYLALIAEMGINNYSIREGSRVKDNRKKLIELCNDLYSINIISTICSYIILLFLILFWKRLDGYAELLFVQSLGILFTTIGTDWINTIFEDYMYITVRYIICQFVSISFMLIFVKGEQDYVIYALASVSSVIIANITNRIYIKHKYNLEVKFNFNISMLKHLRPIIILFSTSIASTIYVNSDITILGILKSEKEVGLYSVASKIYILVKTMLNALLVVSIPRVSSMIDKKSITVVSEYLSKIYGILLIIVFPACIGLAMLSKDIIQLFSGVEYIDATVSLMILSISLIFATSACFYINVILIPFRLDKLALGSTFVSAFINIVLNFALIPYGAQNAAAFTTLVSEFVMFVLGYLFTRKIIKLDVIKTFLLGILNACITLLSCFFVKRMNLSMEFEIMLSMFVSILSFCVVMLIYYRDFVKDYIFNNKRIR